MSSSDPERHGDGALPQRFGPGGAGPAVFATGGVGSASSGGGGGAVHACGHQAEAAALREHLDVCHAALQRCWQLAGRWAAGHSDVGQAAAAELRDAIRGEL